MKARRTKGGHHRAAQTMRARGAARSRGKLAAVMAVALVSTVTGIVAIAIRGAGTAPRSAAGAQSSGTTPTAGTSLLPAAGAVRPARNEAVIQNIGAAAGLVLVDGRSDGGQAGLQWPARLVLDRADRLSCPPAASACVDLADRLTWLQSGARVRYGPVRMEPGTPGTRHATPRGIFRVAWKAGRGYLSTIYGEPMPYAVFFGPGGIAFHGGEFSSPSHGCVHLSMRDARYYHDHLPVGAEVVVF
jgi:hypothetical protein